MIDPRKAPVAMLPYLNAIAGHMIHAAAPLRVVNVEDTEQMITEAADEVDAIFDVDIDVDVMEEEMRFARTGLLDFELHTAWIAAEFPAHVKLSGDAELFLSSLKVMIEEAV